MKIKTLLPTAFLVLFMLFCGCSYDDDCCPDQDEGQNREVTILSEEDDLDVLHLKGKIGEPSGMEAFQWVSDMDGSLGFGSELKIRKESLSEGIHKITLSVYENGLLSGEAGFSVSIEHPEPEKIRKVEIVSPADGTDITYEITSVVFRGFVTNASGTEVLKWISDIEGELGYGDELEINSADLSESIHKITLVAHDEGSFLQSDSISILVSHMPPAHDVEIVLPADGTKIAFDESIVDFKGSVDFVNGDEIFIWMSNIDGELGKGMDLSIPGSRLSAGNHRITLLVYLGPDLSGSAEISIIKEAEPVDIEPETKILTGPPTYFSGNHFVVFTWEGVCADNDVLTYKYNLSGPLSTDWVYTSETRNAKICINRSGNYTFSVASVNSKGLEDSTPAVYRFEAYACST